MASKRTNPLLRVLDTVPAKWWLAGLAALLLAVSAIFGGLDDASVAHSEPITLAPGDEFVGPELTTSVTSARLTDTPPGLSLDPDEGNTYLVVTAIVTNTWTTSTILIGDLLQLEWLDSDTAGESDRTSLLSDGTSLPQANPGVPIEVAYIWELPEDDLAPGDTIPVSIRSKTLTVDGDVSYGSYWSTPVVAARVDLEIAR